MFIRLPIDRAITKALYKAAAERADQVVIRNREGDFVVQAKAIATDQEIIEEVCFTPNQNPQ